MALIGTIRKNNWILIVAIGLALAAFILMDMFSGDKSVFGSQNATTLGTIDGQKVDVNEFYRVENALYPNSGGDMYARRNVLWDYFVEEAIIKKEAEALGLNVGRDEMMDLQYGTNLSPIIQQRFRDNTTGQVNREQLTQIKQLIESNGVQAAISNGQLGPSFPHYWSHQMREVEKDRLQSKLSTLVQKSVYTPTWMAEMTHTAQNEKVDFTYVKIPFDEVTDEVSVADSDLQAYLNDHKTKYLNDEETRKVGYLTFNIVPSTKDSTEIRDRVAGLISNFQEADDDSTFVLNNNGIISNVYFKKDQVSKAFADTLANAPIGAVVGPYLDGKTYTVAKLLDRKVIPDSVRSRHILITAKTDVEYQQAFQKIDSLKNLIEAGTHRFDSLAVQFSQGPSAPKGGDLGFAAPNRMVKPFNDLIFYEAEFGKVYPVVSNFGVHLVEVLDQKFLGEEESLQYATISETIIPSSATQKAVYNVALDFIANNADLEAIKASADQNPDLTFEYSPALKRNDFIVGTLGSGLGSRDMIKWAFNGNTEVGQRSDDIYEYQDPVDFYANKYVVAGLVSIQPAGNVAVANVRDEIHPLVVNLKKGEAVKGKIGGQDLTAIAATYNTQVDTITAASFNSSYLPDLGSEPKVIAAACNLEPNSVSQPIVGTNGIYLVRVSNKTAPTTASNIPSLRKQAAGTYQAQVNRQLLQAMRKTANIKDNRSIFY